MSCSSCIALLGFGVVATTVAADSSDSFGAPRRREGAEREARQRELHAWEAAVIRQRYRAEEMRSETARALLPVPSSEGARSLTPPPLVLSDPARTPLRPRATP